MPENNNNNEKPTNAVVQKWNERTSGWRPYIEKSLPLEDLDELMVGGSIPSFGFYFMLFLSAVIATLGLLANSAPAIIGAMIIAPLMAPIISFAYSIDIFDWKLARRSVITIITGVLLVIAVGFLCTTLVGIRFAGTEILSRTSPTLLDLGVAIAAGAAAAFSFTRQSIATSIAGVAISVALVPPLAVTGIGLAYGRSAFTDVGLSLTELGLFSGGNDIALGSFILFATNLLGIVLFACLVFLSQGYGQWKKAGLGIMVVLVASLVIIEPLQKSLYRLTVKSKVLSLIVEMPKKYPHIFTGRSRVDNIYVNYHGDLLHINIEGVTPTINLPKDQLDQRIQIALDLFRKHLQQELGTKTSIELNLIPIDVLNAYSGSKELNPLGFKSPKEQDAAGNNNENHPVTSN